MMAALLPPLLYIVVGVLILIRLVPDKMLEFKDSADIIAFGVAVLIWPLIVVAALLNAAYVLATFAPDILLAMRLRMRRKKP
jgi:hypothetical protein